MLDAQRELGIRAHVLRELGRANATGFVEISRACSDMYAFNFAAVCAADYRWFQGTTQNI